MTECVGLHYSLSSGLSAKLISVSGTQIKHCWICAGVIGLPPKDGVDQQLRINHFGPFLLTSLLLPELARNARIVNVASRAHQQGSLKISDSTIQGIPSNW